jgi:L-alanine-DL-glutamate epimerase-like enolase superfamily enzyme
MTLYDRIAELPLTIEGYALEPRAADVSSGFLRRTTTYVLSGAGHIGRGEDVGYDGDDQEALQRAGAVQPLAGSWTLGSFCEHLEGLELWPEPARHEASRQYRIWGYESAALDLALRQAGTSLHGLLGREPRPVSFVCSRRLNDPEQPSDVTRVTGLLERYPTLRFKLDPTPDWDADIVAALVSSGAVDSIDFKGLYEGTVVDTPADPDFYARIAAAFPDAWIEDPRLTPEIDEVLRGDRDRITWDANIHSVDDVDALPFPPKMVNVKPSRFGPLRELLRMYETCEQRGIAMYGGGQFELGPGRGQIQLLASIFHPDGPNDVAPTGYNEVDPPDGLPASPLPVAAHDTGLAWG